MEVNVETGIRNYKILAHVAKILLFSDCDKKMVHHRKLERYKIDTNALLKLKKLIRCECTPTWIFKDA